MSLEGFCGARARFVFEFTHLSAGAKWAVAKSGVETGFGGPVRSLRPLQKAYGPPPAEGGDPWEWILVRMPTAGASQAGPDRQDRLRPSTPPPPIWIPPNLDVDPGHRRPKPKASPKMAQRVLILFPRYCHDLATRSADRGRCTAMQSLLPRPSDSKFERTCD